MPEAHRRLYPVTLKGRHVCLRPLNIEDVHSLLAAADEDRESYAYATVPATRAAMESYVQDALRQQDAGQVVVFTTVARDGGRVVGSTRFLHITYFPWPEGSSFQRGETLPDDVEIG